MSDVYPKRWNSARLKMREGVLAMRFTKQRPMFLRKVDFALGHLTESFHRHDHLEHPSIGANTQIELKENMVV